MISVGDFINENSKNNMNMQQVARTGWESQLKSKESEILNKQELLYEKDKIYLWL